MKKKMALVLTLALFYALTCTICAANAVPKKVIEAINSVVCVDAEYGEEYSLGSGFVITNDQNHTLIATNHHVVEGKPYEIFIYIGNDEKISAHILYDDPDRDMAILEITASISLPALKLSTVGASLGDAVYAIGFPGGADLFTLSELHNSEDATITDGIVGAVRKSSFITENGTGTLLQINAAINSGNSGGPLVNEKGEVVGINTFGITDAQGIFGAIAVCEMIDFLKENDVDISTSTFFSFDSIPLYVYIVVGIVFLLLIIWGIALSIVKKKSSKTVTEKHEDSIVEIDQEALKRKKRTIKIVARSSTIIFAVLIFGVVGGGYIYTYLKAVRMLEDARYSDAEKYLVIPRITEIHDKPLLSYVEAGILLEAKQYDEAKVAFDALGTYRNADQKVVEVQYQKALNFLENFQYDEAKETFETLGTYNNADQMVFETQYQEALKWIEDGEYNKAEIAFYHLKQINYKDAADQELRARYEKACYTLYNLHDYDSAYKAFYQLAENNYNDSLDMKKEVYYVKGTDLLKSGKIVEAYITLSKSDLLNYKDVNGVLEKLKETIYNTGVEKYFSNRHEASTYFNTLGDYKDAKKYSVLSSIIAFPWHIDEDKTFSKLLEIYPFADSEKYFVMNQGIAELFLNGRWETSSGDKYLKMKNGDISYNLPWFDYGDIYGITNGELRLYDISDDGDTYRVLFEITVVNLDQIYVYCHKNGESYTLYRQ